MTDGEAGLLPSPPRQPRTPRRLRQRRFEIGEGVHPLDGELVQQPVEVVYARTTDQDTNLGADVFVHDRETGTTERVSVASGGVEGDGGSFSPAISVCTGPGNDSVAVTVTQ